MKVVLILPNPVLRLLPLFGIFHNLHIGTRFVKFGGVCTLHYTTLVRGGYVVTDKRIHSRFRDLSNSDKSGGSGTLGEPSFDFTLLKRDNVAQRLEFLLLMDESLIINIMEEQATSAGDQSDRPPAPNPKASRARLWRARRKNDLSVEQLEDARRKNRYQSSLAPR